jgi:hypothetical protein
MNGKAVIPSPRSEFVTLGRTPVGKTFKKHLLSYGQFAHPNIPGEKLSVDEAMVDTLISNFRSGVCDIVQVPVVDDQNRHVEDPFRNIGEVIDLTKEEDGLYATIDVRKNDAADNLGKTLLGISAMMHLDYTDTRSGEKVGPTLLHAAVTNRPYITNLKNFEEVIAASVADTDGEAPRVLMALTGEEHMTKEEMIASLRDEHGIDVEALQMSASDEQTPAAPAADMSEMVEAFAAVLKEAGSVSLSRDPETDISIKDVAEAVIELSQEKVALAEQVAELTSENEARKNAAIETEIDSLVQAGRILPKQRDAMLKLAREDRETFEALVPDNSLVSLSEDGVTVHEAPENEKLDEEVARLSALANEMTGR